VRVTKGYSDTTFAKIIHLVEEAQSQKADSQRFVDVFAKYYTPSVMVLALLVFLVPPMAADAPWGVWFYRAQNIRGGTLKLKVIEGRLESFSTSTVKSSQIATAFPTRPGSIIRLPDLEQGMDQLERATSVHPKIELLLFLVNSRACPGALCV
jgi:E1-E2 ATPase/POTRA domain